jgi:Polyketide cyclase / dehydrase and lipid transport
MTGRGVLKWGVGLTLAALVGVLLWAATRPAVIRVQRTLAIQAPPAKIHPLISSMRQFNTWNPYLRKDPNVKGSYRGSGSGPGSAYDFEGNQEVGKGSIEIMESEPTVRVSMKLDMIEPFKASNTIDFTLVPRGDATDVTWAMQGASPFVARLVGVFINMDHMIGRDFEAGLANLKAEAEKP